MGKQQNSKRSRAHRKQAKHFELARNEGHPSHMSGRRWKKIRRWSNIFYKLFRSQIDNGKENGGTMEEN